MKPILCVGGREALSRYVVTLSRFFEIVSPKEYHLDRRYLLIQNFESIRGYTQIDEVVFLEDSDSLKEINAIRKYVEVLRPRKVSNIK